MTKDWENDLTTTLRHFCHPPAAHSDEGQILEGPYKDWHLYSVCGGPRVGGHVCYGFTLAKTRAAAKDMAKLVEAASVLRAELGRLRGVLEDLADEDTMWKRIEEAEDCGGDGVRCAYKQVQALARDALGIDR